MQDDEPLGGTVRATTNRPDSWTDGPHAPHNDPGGETLLTHVLTDRDGLRLGS